MKRIIWLIAFSFLLFSSWVIGQDGEFGRPLEHADYDIWNTINSSRLSNNGEWIAYSIRNGKDKVTLKIRHAKTKREYSIDNGSACQFSFDGAFAVYRIAPDRDLIKDLKKKKTKPGDMPTTKIEIVHLESGRHTRIDNIRSFSMPSDQAGWVAILLNKPRQDDTLKQANSLISQSFEVTESGLKTPSQTVARKRPKNSTSNSPSESKKAKTSKAAPDKRKSEKSNDAKTKKKKTAGTTLILHNLETGLERRFPNVTSYRFNKFGKVLVFATSIDDSAQAKNDDDREDDDGVFVFDMAKNSLTQIIAGRGNYKSLASDESGSQVAFVTDRDDYAAKKSSWSLYRWRTNQKEAIQTAAMGMPGLPEGWTIAETAAPQFSEDGKRLYFNTAPKPDDPGDEKESEAEPKAVLDIWHWQDPQLQPQQLLRAEQERNRSYRAMFDSKSKKIIQLATLKIPTVMIDPRSMSDSVVGVSDLPYRKLMSWDAPGFRDVFLIDLKTGKSERILERARNSARMSPGGQFLTWWDHKTKAWYSIPTKKSADGRREKIKITKGIASAFYNELHDTPSDPRPYGIAGWLENDEAVLVYDRFDIWQLDPSGVVAPKQLTENSRKNHRRFRFVRLDPRRRSFAVGSTIMLSMFDEATKGSGYFILSLNADADEKDSGESTSRLKQLIVLEESISGLVKARNSDAVIFTRSSFRRSPDIWYSTTLLKKIDRISQINPQQREYRWGTSELVHWKSVDGTPLDGILYKPDGFDPTQKHPLMVYFYERSSDRLHRYYAPAAGRSTINFSFYVSRGYLIFVPDIPYKTGLPGQSAADAILPGVKHIVSLGFVDDTKIGMQGHSWGGYQTAFLVTQTDMFCCAESGAPVSNMTSAYGGIRWGSGMSRMFQYERTQSRIGKTLWEDREAFIKNSPLFYADKINTPLLILHNDEDGAVPWYQGIELFVALRRLGQPAWMLNYNKQPHWVMKPENRVDFARRMQQFFDHYMMDAPLPEWMANGIPAVDKGKKFGFEPAEEISPPRR